MPKKNYLNDSFLSFTTAKPVKLLESKSHPGYFVTAGYIEEGYYHILKLKIPGNTGLSGTISFQTSENKWLSENSSNVEAAPYRNTLRFRLGTTFVQRKGGWLHEGYFAFESSVSQGHFLRPRGYHLRVEKFENSTGFKDDASWKIVDRGRISIHKKTLQKVLLRFYA